MSRLGVAIGRPVEWYIPYQAAALEVPYFAGARHFCKEERKIILQYFPFWVIPRRLTFNSRRFGTPYRFHLHR